MWAAFFFGVTHMTQSVVGALRVVLGLDSAEFERGLTAAQKQLRGAAKSMQQAGHSMMQGGAALTIGITAPFIALVTTSREAAIESRTAVGQVESSLASMGNAAGRSQKQLEAQAKALQGLSVFDDDDILRKVTANLLTFGNVAGTVFDRAQLAAVNLSARLGTDLQGSTLMLGKALQNPVKGMTALTRAGVSLSPVMQERIKALVKTGQLESAQILLLQEIETQYRGAAAAQRAADPDAAARDAWREMQETLGGIALNVLPPLTAALVTAMDAFNNLSPEMQATVVGGVAVAAALGPVVTVLGAVVTAGGGLVGVLSKVSLGTGAAAGGTSLLATAMGGLRATMMFLVTTPWGLLITGIAVAVGLLIMKSREATPAQKALEKATDDLTKATDDYEEAVRIANLATGDAKTSAMQQVRALRVLQEEKRRTAARALELAEAELTQADAAREAYRTRLMNAGEGMGTYARVSGGGPQVMSQREYDALKGASDVLRDRIRSADERVRSLDVGLRAPVDQGGDGSGDGSTSTGGLSNAGQAAQEAQQRARTVQDMAHQLALEEAQLKNDLDRVRVLEREGAVRERTRALVDAGIMTDAAAAVEAERIQQRLDAALDERMQQEERAGRRDFERQLWEIDGRQDMINKIEREVMLEERVAFWRGKTADLVTATAAATSDLLEMDLARAEAAERSAVAAQREHNIELARLRGDGREERRLSRLAEIDDRAQRYQTDRENPLSPTDARARAEREVTELDDAEMTGRFRDFVKEGWQAAMDGDLTDFARKWVTEWAGRGLEDALNSLADVLMQIFKSTDWSAVFGGGNGGAGGGFWSGVGNLLSSAMGGGKTAKVPGFANGGSILPGGSGGIDSQLIQFNKSPGERVDIYTPGKDRGAGGGGPISFDLRGAVMTSDLLGQMQGMAAASGGAAYQSARQTVPTDLAYSDRYRRGRR